MKKLIAALTTITVAFTLMVPTLMVSNVSAQADDSDGFLQLDQVKTDLNLPGVGDDFTEDVLRQRVIAVIQFILGFLGLVAILIIIYGGFVYMTAAGNDERVGKARATITAGLIGLLIIVLAYGLTQFVVSIVTRVLDGTFNNAGGA